MTNPLWIISAKRILSHCFLIYSFQVYSHSEIHGNPFHQRRSAVTSRHVFCYICARKEVRTRNALLSIQCTTADTSIRRTPLYNGHLELVPAFLYSFYLTLYKTDNCQRRTLSTGPRGVWLSESWLYIKHRKLRIHVKSQVIRRLVNCRVGGQKISAKILGIIWVGTICSGWFIIALGYYWPIITEASPPERF